MSEERAMITVFGSSRPQAGEAEYEEARELGGELARRGFAVCSGGYGGVMEAVSRGAKEAGGRTVGVTADFFSVRVNEWIEEEIRVATLAVVWEMVNKQVIAGKPLVVLGDFWQPVLERVREVERVPRWNRGGHASRWGEANGDLVHVAATVEDAAGYLGNKLRRPQ
ncbi:MAG: hypothetical protein LAN71_13405 [Acidobacteriia bacterium]|nr:hypothetical protein [Terriglobia bacterium]